MAVLYSACLVCFSWTLKYHDLEWRGLAVESMNTQIKLAVWKCLGQMLAKISSGEISDNDLSQNQVLFVICSTCIYEYGCACLCVMGVVCGWHWVSLSVAHDFILFSKIGYLTEFKSSPVL